LGEGALKRGWYSLPGNLSECDLSFLAVVFVAVSAGFEGEEGEDLIFPAPPESSSFSSGFDSSRGSG
jgi:hypothetical protein